MALYFPVSFIYFARNRSDKFPAPTFVRYSQDHRTMPYYVHIAASKLLRKVNFRAAGLVGKAKYGDYKIFFCLEIVKDAHFPTSLLSQFSLFFFY